MYVFITKSISICFNTFPNMKTSYITHMVYVFLSHPSIFEIINNNLLYIGYILIHYYLYVFKCIFLHFKLLFINIIN